MTLILQNPKFRLLWISGVFGDLGLVMYFMIHGWLALSISDSPFWVGATAGVNGLGLMVFSVFGGVLADRMRRRNLVLGGLLVRAVIALALATLIFSEHLQLWHVIAAAFLDGIVAAFIVPARMALTLDLVGRERLLNATAASFASMTIMGIVAPLVGGSVVSAFDIGWAYVIMGGAYLSSLGVLITLRGIPRTERSVSSPWQDLKQGVHYVFTAPTTRTLILIVFVNETFGWAHESMLSVMARDVLLVGASGLGYMMAAASAGGTVSTLTMSSLSDVKNKGRLLVLGLAGFGLFLMLFAWSDWFALSLVLLALAYASVIAYEATLNTLLQTSVPNEMRGRVLSFQAMMWGVSGVSGFQTGAIASRWGAPVAIAIGGGIVFLNALRLLPRAARFQEQPAEEAVGG